MLTLASNASAKLERFHPQRFSRRKELNLMVDATNACQLGCRYCYYGQKGGDFLHVNLVARAIKNLVQVFPQLKAVNIHYMGGEPLLAWDQMLELNYMLRGRLSSQGIKFRWGLTSNLVALNKERTEHMINEKASIHCSVDGPAEIHNCNRPYRDGRPSYQDVAANIPLALRISPEDTARVTVCPEHAGRLTEIADSLLGYGFKTVGFFPAYNQPWSKTAIEEWKNSLVSTFERYQPSVKKGEHRISTIIRHPSDRREFFSFCGAGVGLWAFDVFGRLYHCHHFTNLPKLAIIEAAENTPEVILKAIDDSRICPRFEAIPTQCHHCAAREFCNGSCWAENLITNGDANVPALMECRMRQETALALQSFFSLSTDEEENDCSGCEECKKCVECEICVDCQTCEPCEGCEQGEGCKKRSEYCESPCDTCQFRCEIWAICGGRESDE